MSSGGDNFKHESLQDRDSIIKYFTALSEGFHNGSLSFSADDKKLLLRPAGMIRLEVEAKRKGNQVKLALVFRWSEESAAAPEEAEKPLVIGSGEEG